MTDREKVIKGLQCMARTKEPTSNPCNDCGYVDRPNFAFCVVDVAIDALELLKEQPEQKHGHWVSVPDKSPKTTTINMYSFIYSCSECGKMVGHHAEYNYCPGCGAIMTWMVNQDES